MSDQTNPILRYFKIVRPQLWEEPIYQRVAFVLHHAITRSERTDWDELTDALAEMIPEDREFWYRVQASWNVQFAEAMAHMLAEPAPEEKK